MTREMKISWNSINFKKSFHSTPLALIDISDDSLNFLIITHATIIIFLVLWKDDFLEIVFNVNEMYFKDIFNI